MLLVVALFLSCAVLTSGSPAVEGGMVQLPTEQEYLVYDIRGPLSKADLFTAFDGINIEYGFSDLPERRRIILVKKDNVDNTEYKGGLPSLPDNVSVDVHALESLSDIDGFLVGGGKKESGIEDQEKVTFSNEDLYMVELTIYEYGVDAKEFMRRLHAFNSQFKDFINTKKPRVFHYTGVQPYRGIVFVQNPAYMTDRMILFGDQQSLGGQYQAKFTTTPVTLI